MSKLTGRQKEIVDTIALLRAQLPSPTRDDLVDAVYNDVELVWRPGQENIYFPKKMKGASDGYECGKTYRIPRACLNERWWKAV